MSELVEVRLWGTRIGTLGYPPEGGPAVFEYDSDFARSGIQLSPVVMPCPPRLHRFTDISERTFKGLPGIFADSLPDGFGNKLIDLYLAERGISPGSITALDRLLYVGSRGMGALEYHPAREFSSEHCHSLALDIHSLTELAGTIVSRDEARRSALLKSTSLHEVLSLIRVGSSAGGARAKALVARTGDGTLVDGSGVLSEEHSYWILKFDVDSNADRDSTDAKGMPRVEYIYSILARNCGIDMPETDFLVDGDSFHFLIRRFDRPGSQKLQYASWAALAHADRDSTGAYSYEQLVLLARQLGLGQDSCTELFRRAVFNIIARNQDDHTKNFGFLMDKTGAWRLSPAFDMVWSFDPAGTWTRTHQIRLNRKQDQFSRDDLLAFGRYCNLNASKAGCIIDEIHDAFSAFPVYAQQYDVDPALASRIAETLRMDV